MKFQIIYNSCVRQADEVCMVVYVVLYCTVLCYTVYTHTERYSDQTQKLRQNAIKADASITLDDTVEYSIDALNTYYTFASICDRSLEIGRVNGFQVQAFVWVSIFNLAMASVMVFSLFPR